MTLVYSRYTVKIRAEVMDIPIWVKNRLAKDASLELRLRNRHVLQPSVAPGRAVGADLPPAGRMASETYEEEAYKRLMAKRAI